MNQPLVSICIPTYNSEKYIRQCLDSVISQTYKNIEVIIVDDGSTDRTYAIASEYVERSNVTLYRNEINLGADETSSRLVNLAHGEFIALYHSDDVYRETIVERSVAILTNDKSIGLVGTMADIVDADGKYLGEFHLHSALRQLKKNTFNFDEIVLGVLLNSGNDIILVTPSVMARAITYREMGAFCADKYLSAYDYEMWLRIANKYEVAVIEDKLMSYRIHENQISELQIRKNIEIQNIILVLRDYHHYIRDRNLAQYCDALLDKWIYRTAKKQNIIGFFDRSNVTLGLVRSRKYLPMKWILKVLNRARISIKRRKG